MTGESALRAFLSEYTEYEKICRNYCLQSHLESEPWRPPDTREGKIPHNVWFTMTTPIFLVRHERYTYSQCHTHVQLEMMYMLEGSCSHAVEGKDVPLYRGDICLIPPGAHHQPQVFDDSLLVNILIDTTILKALCTGLDGLDSGFSRFIHDIRFAKRYPSYLLCRPGADEALRALFVLLISEFYEDKPHAHSVVQGLLNSIFTILGRDFASQTTLSTDFIAGDRASIQILQYMRSSPYTANLQQLSEKFHYSKQHICRIVRDATGMRFGEYLNLQRLRVVKQLLCETDWTVKEIAEYCGYAENTYFHRMFKNQTGMTPLEFRAASKKIPQPRGQRT